ncbi:MAG: SEC-C metal-binding domain-containing protein [Planctomycetota bacterium]
MDDKHQRAANRTGHDAKKPRKLHPWSACPCGSGQRFAHCCGKSGGDSCRYDVDSAQTDGEH